MPLRPNFRDLRVLDRFDLGTGVPSTGEFGGTLLPITVGGGIGPIQLDIPIPGTEGIPGTISIGGGGGDEIGDPSLPGLPEPTGIARPTGDGCLPFYSRDPVTGKCVLDLDPGAGTGLPGGGAAAGTGLTRPTQVARRTLVCPKFADNKTGILWMNALTGDVVCLPRRTSGKGFGLIRKNPPRAKPYISAAEKKLLTKIKTVQNRAKKFAGDAGFACKKR